MLLGKKKQSSLHWDWQRSPEPQRRHKTHETNPHSGHSLLTFKYELNKHLEASTTTWNKGNKHHKRSWINTRIIATAARDGNVRIARREKFLCLPIKPFTLTRTPAQPAAINFQQDICYKHNQTKYSVCGFWFLSCSHARKKGANLESNLAWVWPW